MANTARFKARKIVPGKATGPALVARRRFTFSAGADPKRGVWYTPTSHPELRGASFAGKVVIYISGNGGSGAARGLDKCVRAGKGPAAVVNLELDTLTVIGCASQDIPMVQVEDPSIFDQVKNGDVVVVDADKGEVVVSRR